MGQVIFFKSVPLLTTLHLQIDEFFQTSASQLKIVAEFRVNVISSLRQTAAQSHQASPFLKILSHHLISFGKLFRRLQQLSPTRFVALPTCSELIFFYWSQIVDASNEPLERVSDSDGAIYPVRYLVQGMVLFKESLAQWTATRKKGIPNENSLSEEFVQNAVSLLVTRFLPLNPGDLEKWMVDPEEWVNVEEKEKELWEFELRPCSERVLVQLCSKHSHFVTPLLIFTFEHVVGQSPSDIQSILQKEALYCAIGRCGIHLKDLLPFNKWLEHTLTSEARETNPSYPIIKRRIAWVIGKWVADRCTSPNNPKIWDILLHLLKDRGVGTDAVVRLTAAIAVGECVNTIDFDPKCFEPFLATAISELVLLIGEIESLETKRRINFALNIVIEQSGEMILPFFGIITEALPKLWSQAGDQWLFKSSLLVTVMKLIESTKAGSTSLGSIVVPLVRECLSPSAATHLDEDGLNLWSIALRNTVSLLGMNGTPALFDLLPQAIELLATHLDLLGLMIKITESYILLDAPMILQVCNHQLLSAYLAAFKSRAVAPLNASDMLKTLEILVQTSPSSLWGDALHSSGLFEHILDTLVEEKVPTSLLTEIICLLSRISIVDPQVFIQLISAASASKNFKEDYLYNAVFDQWFSKFDNMSEPRYRKLAAMGIAALVSTGRHEILERLASEIFNLWIDVFYEIKEAKLANERDGEDEDSVPSPTSLRRHWDLDEAPASFYQNTSGTPEYDRRKAVYDRDPVRTIHLGTFIGARLREAQAAYDPQVFHTRYISKCEAAVLEQIQTELARA